MPCRRPETHKGADYPLALAGGDDNIEIMEILGKYSALTTLAFLLLIGFYFLVKGLIGYGKIAREAGREFDVREKDDALGMNISRDGFVRAYRRFYAPRKDIYRGGGILAATLLTVPAIRLFEYASEAIWIMSGKPYEYGPGTLIWQFMLYFALIAFWGIIFFAVAKFYHQYAPRTFRDELIKEAN